MSQLVIETDWIKKGVLYFFAIAGIAIVGCWIGMGLVDHYISEEVRQAVASASTPETAPVTVSGTASSTTVALPVQQFPYVIEFTVLSTTIANGHYTVFTTAGQTLYMPDFSSWNSCYPQNTYSATITGVEGNGALDAGAINLIYRIYYPPAMYPVNYPWYYYYSGMYFRYDGSRTTQVPPNLVTGQRVIDGRPPNWNTG